MAVNLQVCRNPIRELPSVPNAVVHGCLGNLAISEMRNGVMVLGMSHCRTPLCDLTENR
jgi:hypothetical protein